MSTQSSTSPQTEDSLAAFGANEWVVEEIYQQYLADPASVDPAWHEFFADYKPTGGAGPTSGPSGNGAAASAPTKDRADGRAGGSTSSSNGSVPTPAELANKTAPKPAPPKPGPKPGPSAGVVPTPVAKPAPPKGATAAPVKPAPAKPAPAAKAEASAKPAEAPAEKTGPETRTIRGAAARIVQNMEASLEVPTATSVRAVPAKLLADNRIVINSNLARSRGGKVSFTHLIGWAQVKAAIDHPEMNNSYTEVDGKPALVIPDHINLGLAIDLQQKDGSRSLVVASIKKCETLDFQQFWQAYEDIVRRARNGKLTTDDFAGTTISLTNPGGIGTVHSMPRLTKGQGAIIGVGAMEYPAEFSGLSEEQLANNAISKVITLTSTYDHRIIQGAQSGEFLKRMHQLLLGSDGFYDEIFASLRIPYEPVRWVRDVTTVHEGEIDKTSRILELIHSYRVRGHLMADTDPLEYRQRRHADLDILEHGLTLWDLDRSFPVGGFAGNRTMKLREILGVLRDSYCRRIGVEYMHIQDPAERAWIAKRVEVKHAKPDTETQKRILSKLNEAEAFETFLQTKFVGQKRFSLEGAEAVIPLLDEVLQASAEDDLDELVIGMAHRGRLNVLTNIVGKPYEKVFNEFEGNMDPESTQGSGDVKYHLGAESKYTTPDGQHTIKVSLTSNPSHLEAVNPVLEGIVRAKQDVLDKGLEGFTVLPVLLHGDAAFAGQGVVAETLNLSQLRGYRTGGTVHVVVNNQVGFTTAPAYSRSSFYSTDVARMIQAPIFHVNGDDPEACIRVARLAFDYRQAFHKDVVIDLVCYRRRGHNEGDDPSMSNPEMYAIIDNKRSVRKLYTEALIGRGDITVDEAEEALKDFQGKLEQVFRATKDSTQTSRREPTLQSNPSSQVVETAVSLDLLHRVGDAHVDYPEGFHPHPRVKPLMEKRRKMAYEGNVDWAFGEILALGTLVAEGKIVRLAGQDSRRGTFVQRHSVLIDKENGSEFTPLDLLGARNNQGTGRFFVHDSLLSEYAAMGFEYGYSLAMPDALVLWEAQFGDFVNGAQTVIDEFVSSGEAKWGQRSGVGLLLPHGQEGQGPDHSSGRIERFLQMCAEDNMTVVDCTTPANWFHLLRRQALSGIHRPLVAFTPKSLLRHRAAVSSLEEFTEGSKFQPVIDDPGIDGVKPDPAKVKRVLLCSGKLYYDLAAARAQRKLDDVAIVRLEQLYPLPVTEAREVLGRYPNAEDHVWVQEEAANQGAWSFVALNLLEQLEGVRLRRVSRKAAASPAVGSAKVHEQEQKALIEAALPSGA
ncbi:multifunctional oxoglutarate decarboxylase/oxoglutarate dehydrogenase thiamine pyrophosphate-binding subunit/dihydrolipoyllysine-residue succinyltransferase subunit [Cryptosporangium phraense]|uniref:Multifunctional oxoglutarate decarboxylase/oxoglutarate dehydrogenase thiamine pyrophosphate-binding subunit/dihydrolipoyllysine-residue succinyltransferase subunit n=1 Tax=Cryptosporangium phraense TaxID=2593070 RepID=A0A545ALW4_9ACTN|nr:multifunctional oxoglutarate decarboxylase/oxoglutarate dehydrogenase thiamine pyrophosphate-binding subunit/dihydrolipoyllysine-residue succinyltransferase subunit [Cryptosporangium phraense]TQS42260.1 multifunctional oxoglutarate decarboxylase/oxoglutarate dehydrogenase thiamine pyrophosphate-binding subunit/dihydrolipoyllysine-residue succinyltransferase subunit [Cryptosporangium phraense]